MSNTVEMRCLINFVRENAARSFHLFDGMPQVSRRISVYSNVRTFTYALRCAYTYSLVGRVKKGQQCLNDFTRVSSLAVSYEK